MAKRHTTGKPQSGRLRIVAGKWRSRLLRIADVPGLRPSSERIRETLFNWLTPRIHGAHCLDLFAGTGALGLEALSRGAKRAVFVETSERAVRALNDNIKTLDATGAVVLQSDAMEYLEREHSEKFDLVFLDPPFAANLIEESCGRLAERQILAEGAHIYLEQPRNRPEPDLPAGWHMLKNKTAGNVRYMLVQQEA
jgi:16S rRNA (guanine966-N2)-methyltransferase